MQEVTTIDLGMPGPSGAGITTAQYGAITTVTNQFLTGTGSPEGVVTGTTGQYYLQTDGDIVAMLWRKVSGTATAYGWVPYDGTNRDRFLASCHADPSAATLSAVGSLAWTSPATVSSANSSGGSFNNYLTGSVSGNASGPNGPPLTRLDWGFDVTFRISVVDTVSTRIHVGLYASDPSGAVAPTADGAGFRYSDGTDTAWACRSSDGAATGANTSGVAVSAGNYYLRMVGDTTRVRYYVQDAFVVERTTNLPTATTMLAPYVRVTTQAAAGKSVKFGYMNLLSR